MKYYIALCLSFLLVLPTFALNKDDIVPYNSTSVLTSGSTGTSLLDVVLDFLRDSVFALMAVVAIGMFLFIGGRLIAAQWNPEEFSKAMKSFVYAAVWIFMVAFAWAVVKIVAGIDL